MFKWESYITPIILSYADKYIRNFRLEDSQVSLWDGDASFHNLDLRLEVLEEELQLPFSFVSGHIKELLIHVPWTKLTSEPITITINTIECILKLRGSNSSTSPESTSYTRWQRQKKVSPEKQSVEQLKNYGQLLINKIVSNIRVYCNNVILKYVEEDIVLSMNVKLLKLESANDKWAPSFIDVSLGQVILRKIVTVNDLTICLDKRNAAGKIDVYQEPMLYRCSLTARLLRNYHSATADKASITRFDIYCNNMEFSVTEQQVPMLMRLILLLYTLQQKQLKPEHQHETDAENASEAHSDGDETWKDWALSFVSSIWPEGAEWEMDMDDDDLLQQTGHTLHIGFYVDKLLFSFKIRDDNMDRAYYIQRKIRYSPLITLNLQGLHSETLLHGSRWFNLNFGISEILLMPAGYCVCFHKELVDDRPVEPYLTIGNCSQGFRANSLFDEQASENRGHRRTYNTDWYFHVIYYTDTVLLGRSPAFAMHYVYDIQMLEDMNSEALTEMGDDLEYSNLKEFTYIKTCVGGLRLKICSGLCHRLQSLKEASRAYDYQPYIILKPDVPLKDLLPPSSEDFDALNEFVPTKTIKMTILHPVIELIMPDHRHLDFVSRSLSNMRRTSTNHYQSGEWSNITIECEKIDIIQTVPKYVNRLVQTTCQLPDPPQKMFDDCYLKRKITVTELTARLSVGTNLHSTIVTPFNFTLETKSIYKPQYWINPNVPHDEISLESEILTFNGTKPQFLVLHEILERYLNITNEDFLSCFDKSSLIVDVRKNKKMPYLEISLENIRIKKVITRTTNSWNISLGSLKIFIFEPDCDGKSRETQQVLILSGPESCESEQDDVDLFTATVQYPVDVKTLVHPPLLVFNLKEITLCVDPLLYKWLSYFPKITLRRVESDIGGNLKETPRRVSSHIESVHNSSEREPAQKLPKTTNWNDLPEIKPPENFSIIFKRWMNVWKNLIILGDVSQMIIFFPTASLSAVGSKGIEEAIENAIIQDNTLEIMSITLPSATVKSSHKQDISRYLKLLPVELPDGIWASSNLMFPWTLSLTNLHLHTVQNAKRTTFIQSVTINATIGFTTKSDESKSLGFCIHIDMTPLLLTLTEMQVYLIANILNGLSDSIQNLMPEKKKSETKTLDSLPSIPIGGSQNLSPSDKPESIEYAITANETDDFVLSAWIQWTIPKFTINLTTDLEKNLDILKLVLDAEDIVFSIDFQNVYIKFKSKIGSVSLQHYKLVMDKWQSGNFSGIVMQLREDLIDANRLEDNSFMNITITRASCQHTHNLWGANKNAKKMKKIINNSRYITEIVVNLRPIDIIVSPESLKEFYLILASLNGKADEDPNVDDGKKFNGHNLPLAYFECQNIRLIVPSYELYGNNALYDVLMVQIQKIHLTPSAVNPICRTPIKLDIYQQAAQARILNIPGSEVEDRQYQLNLLGVTVSTTKWNDFNHILYPNVKGISENPALEWNNLETGQLSITPPLNFWQIAEKFDINIIVAPAMIYNNEMVICGNSMEINFVSDLSLNLSLAQLKLLTTLSIEFRNLLLTNDCGRYNYRNPYLKVEKIQILAEESDGFQEISGDSGEDLSYIRSIFTGKFHENSVRESVQITPNHPNSGIPLDILFTAGKIEASLYEVDELNYSHRFRLKKKVSLKKIDYDCGYEASEESSVDIDEKSDNYAKFIPLIYISLSQPNLYLSRQYLCDRMQMSVFDVSVKLSGPEYVPISRIPTSNDFPIHLVETKSGVPNPNTGIPPAFATFKYMKRYGQNAELDLEILRPSKLFCSIDKWVYFQQIRDKLLGNFMDLNTVSHENIQENVTIYQKIRNYLQGINTIGMRLEQLVFVLKGPEDGPVLNLTIDKLKNTLSLTNRPEKLANHTVFECLTISIDDELGNHVILNPLRFSVELCLFWEAWQSYDCKPQLRVNIDSDCLVLNVNPIHLRNIQTIIHEFTDLFIGAGQENVSSDPGTTVHSNDKGQHYKDDLRAGAFQFVDTNTGSIDELPLPYQVMFWNRRISAMAWRYPQPRALTKVRIFPVPYKIDSQDDLEIRCELEYYSECHGCYLAYTQFNLSENEICNLDLPEDDPQTVVAAIWRVVLTTIDNTRISVSPRALAGSMRIDSYFNPTLIPDTMFAMNLAKIKISFYSHYRKEKIMKLPESLKSYKPDLLIPTDQCFLTITFDNLHFYMNGWNMEIFAFDINAILACTILDYCFLTEQNLIDPFVARLQINLSDKFNCNFVAQPIRLRFDPNLAHTLAVSAQLWSQNSDEIPDLIVVTRYVVCNNLNVSVKFKQASTDEDILLPSKYMHLYSWRTHKSQQMLKVALEKQSEWIWSNRFLIDEDGVQVIGIDGENIPILIDVKSISATQKKIIISGQLIVGNMLNENFDLKIVEDTSDKDLDFKRSQSHILQSKTVMPSILIDTEKNYFLRLRLVGISTWWTGDIPMKEHIRNAHPWLVKVPLQEKGQYISVWCRVIEQNIDFCKKILVMLWPLFMIKSNLPFASDVEIATPSLNCHLDTRVDGCGVIQQLHCPGTDEDSHYLTFQLNGQIMDATPSLYLSYRRVDQQNFFKRYPNADIDEIIEVLENYDKPKWPYLGEDFDNVKWLVCEQILTTVQIRHRKACKYSTSLLVELLPWCLMVNTVGCMIALWVNTKELCKLAQNAVVAPSKLDGNFHLSINSGTNWYNSAPLQLAKSDWSQTFYMPKITGTIPLDGSIKTAVKCDTDISMISISSAVVNEIRLLKISSTHVLGNATSIPIYVACFAVPDQNDEAIYEFPVDLRNYCFVIPPNRQKNGVPLIQWHTVDMSADLNITDYALYVSFASNPQQSWSCPVRVDKNFIRKNIAMGYNKTSLPLILTWQEYKEQIYLNLHDDNRPQTLIENQCDITLYCAQSNADQIESECQHFKWHCKLENGKIMHYTMPVLSGKFPDLPQKSDAEKIAFSCDPEDDPRSYQWSSPVSLTINTEYFIQIPLYGEIKVIIKNTACTTYIKITPISHIQILPRDIRVRLSMHEMESADSKLVLRPQKSAPEISGNHELCETSSDNYLENPYNKRASILVPTIPTKSTWKTFRIFTLIKSFNLTFYSDFKKITSERCEIASIIFDTIGLNLTQTETLHLNLSISGIQFDNQLYSRESYDFPVVLIGQNPIINETISSLNMPVNHLMEMVQKNPLFNMELNLETWYSKARNRNLTGIKNVKFVINPLSCFIEDVYFTCLKQYFMVFAPTNLVIWPKFHRIACDANTNEIGVPELILTQSSLVAKTLTFRQFIIEPISILLSVHCSVKLYIALDQSPLQFGRFERKRMFTSPDRLGQILTMHYLSGAIFGAGWVVSSLELLGSPGGLARAMGTGLQDFILLPYAGFLQSPWAFLMGVTQGSASLMKHLTAGTLQSVTKLASSVARNLDRLTLDEEYLRRMEEQRRHKPQGLTQGFLQGLTGLGINIMEAVGGIAHHPLQSVIAQDASLGNLATGVGLGIVGVFTKPLSGAAKLVALTGQGLLQGAGWNSLPEPRNAAVLNYVQADTNAALKYDWKYVYSRSSLLDVVEATGINSEGEFENIVLILTKEMLIVVDADKDQRVKVWNLDEIQMFKDEDDHSKLSVRLVENQAIGKVNVEEDDGCVVEMDPVSRARVADYVRNTVGLIQLSHTDSLTHSEISISPLDSPRVLEEIDQQITTFIYHVNPEFRNYFLDLFLLAKQHEYNFPVVY